MKSITKKLLAGLLGTAMTLSLAACGGRFQQRWHQLRSRSVHRSC